MKHTVDNFDAIRAHLKFDKPGDIYAVHVLFRVKDLRTDEEKQMFLSHDETQRKIKSWFIESFEHWDKKVPQMIDLAIANRARVYVSMTKKNRLVCNRILAKKVIDEIDNPHIKYDGMITSAVCGCHVSDYKWWTLDVDNDTKIYLKSGEYGEYSFRRAKMVDFKDEIVRQIARLVDKTKTRSGSEIFTVPTKNGYHIMTPPFNRSEDILVKNGGSEAVSENDEYGDDGIESFELGDNLKADAMTLAYFQWED